MAQTLFGKIIRGELPAHRVYEDEHVLAFLDVFPLSEGHTLVIPKQEAETLDCLSDEASAAVGRVLPRLCRAIVAATGCPSYTVIQKNGTASQQVVMHVHFHIIPKPNAEQGLHIDWPAGRLDEQAAVPLAQRIRDEVGAD